MRRHFSISLMSCLLFYCSADSQIKQDSSYFPLALGNQWVYNSVYTETVVDTQRVNGRLYYGIARYSSSPSFWLRQDSNKVFIAPTLTIQSDTTNIRESMIYNFLADVNQQWPVTIAFNEPGMDCDYGGDIILISKEDTATTSLGIYRNCITFMHYPPCDDYGRSIEWFARGVGRVCFYEENFWGRNKYDLTKSNLVTSVSRRDHSQSVNTYRLLQNYPNPFNPSTNIDFQLLERSNVVVAIFDALGRKIETLLDSYQERGYHSIIWDAAKQSSGIYFCRIQTKDFNQTIKLVLVQ